MTSAKPSTVGRGSQFSKLKTTSSKSNAQSCPSRCDGLSFSVILLDLSMPILDGMFFLFNCRSIFIREPGFQATVEIREVEAKRSRAYEDDRTQSRTPPRPTKILALTGMSSLDDKRKAFDAGVDG